MPRLQELKLTTSLQAYHQQLKLLREIRNDTHNIQLLDPAMGMLKAFPWYVPQQATIEGSSR